MIRETDLSAIERTRYDAIVVGGGAAGGWAAERLTQGGLSTLVLDAGWRTPFWQAPLRRGIALAVGALAAPAALRLLPPSVIWRGQRALKRLGSIRQPVQSRCYAWETAPESFVDDHENPYETAADHPFTWIRARQLGGRMTIPAHGRQYLRHSAFDFAPGDGQSPHWPFELGTLDPWYEIVERRLQLSGACEGSPFVPDSHITLPRSPSVDEAALIEKLMSRWPEARAMIGRFAPPMDALGSANATGLLACRKGAVARHVEVDAQGRVTGVVFYDRASASWQTAQAPLVFLGASTLETTRILLLSQREGKEGFIGAASGALGRHLMDHVSIKVQGIGPGMTGQPGLDESIAGRCVYLPRFDRREGSAGAESRGYGMRLYQARGRPGTSYFTAVCDAEMLPRAENRVTISRRCDAWGIPVLSIDCTHSEAELALTQRQAGALREVVDLMDVKIPGDAAWRPGIPGAAIHECGTARMGTAPENSVTDPFNQCWDVKGLYVTDGAAFPSEGLQNPTLTILALTARACEHAIRDGRMAAPPAGQ